MFIADLTQFLPKFAAASLLPLYLRPQANMNVIVTKLDLECLVRDKRRKPNGRIFVRVIHTTALRILMVLVCSNLFG